MSQCACDMFVENPPVLGSVGTDTNQLSTEHREHDPVRRSRKHRQNSVEAAHTGGRTLSVFVCETCVYNKQKTIENDRALRKCEVR